jgi:hypothetical protein
MATILLVMLGYQAWIIRGQGYEIVSLRNDMKYHCNNSAKELITMNKTHLFFSLISVLLFCSCSDKKEPETPLKKSDTQHSVMYLEAPELESESELYKSDIDFSCGDGEMSFWEKVSALEIHKRKMPSGGELQTTIWLDERLQRVSASIAWMYDVEFPGIELYSIWIPFSAESEKQNLTSEKSTEQKDTKNEMGENANPPFNPMIDIATVEEMMCIYFEQLNAFLYPKWKTISPSGIEHSAEAAPCALVELTISKDGQIITATFDKPSGNELIDAATKAFLSDLNAVPKPPFEMVVRITLTYYDRFSLNHDK